MDQLRKYLPLPFLYIAICQGHDPLWDTRPLTIRPPGPAKRWPQSIVPVGKMQFAKKRVPYSLIDP